MGSDVIGPVIAVCAEVVSPEILDMWLQAGWMPNLSRMRQEGAWVPLESVSTLSSGAIWPTFFTGVNPARHGQFFTHMQIAPGTYRIVKKYADDVVGDPFWLRMEQSGRRCAVIDVPQTRPVEPFNGVHIVGWGGEYPAWPRSSSPVHLMGEIVKRFSSHPLADRYRVAIRPEGPGQLNRLANDLIRGTRLKASLSEWIWAKGSYDFFLTVFSEPHWAMHLLWDRLDHAFFHPKGLPASRTMEVFRKIMGSIDRTIGALHNAHPSAHLLVFSLSGMGPNYSGWHILPAVLKRLGMSPGKETSGARGSFLTSLRGGPWKTRALERLVSVPVIEIAKSLLPDRFWDRWTRRILYAESNWKESRAFCVPNEYSGAIRINLRGREPNGTVAPGPEYDDVCNRITAALLDLVHVETGRPVVREVMQPRKVYVGEHVSALPDLLVIWANESPVTRVRSPRLGVMELEPPDRRTGAHRPFGVLVASGPKIRRGLRLSKSHILNLAPTILHLAGVDTLGHYDGRVMSELLA
jgi:predicted AlkP superfamily phosphohydrolase/phosphomutase